jgi:hypothetical protein
MGFFSSSTGLNCTDCHSYDSGGDWAKYADDTPLKRTARRMITMMQMINAANFGGRQIVTCYTCHRGVSNPMIMPSINQLYASPPPEEPGDPIAQAQGQPGADSIIDKYIAAVGGAQKVAAFTSFTGTGTYRGYDDSEESPMEMAANAMGQISTVAHPASGQITIATDGRAGWMAYPPTDRPFPLIALTGESLMAAAAARSCSSGADHRVQILQLAPGSTEIDRSAQRDPGNLGAQASRRSVSTHRPASSCG